MSRVNNSGAGTGGRSKASAGKRKMGTTQAIGPAKAKGRQNGRSGRVRGRPFQPPPERKVTRIVDLDPFEKCGPGTTVQRLIRVDEMIDDARLTHLIFFDRHGWYCEHGRTCPAIEHARKHAERGVRSTHTTGADWTKPDRMSATRR